MLLNGWPTATMNYKIFRLTLIQLLDQPMYFYIFITNGSCTPNPGCRKALSLPEGTPFGRDTQHGKKQFLPTACRARYSTWSRNFIPIPEFRAHGPSIMKPRYGSPIFGNPKDNSASPDRRSSKKIPRRNDLSGSQFGGVSMKKLMAFSGPGFCPSASSQ